MSDTTTITPKTDDAYELGTWIGRRQAFAALAGRCSAADAECLRQTRDRRLYRALSMSWEEFCKQRLGISRVSAEKIIQRLEEFGPQYFTLAQATGIKPDDYRRIQGSVRGHALLHAGQEIPIESENAPRLAAAVAELRREADRDQNAASEDAPAQAGTKVEDLTRTLDKVESAFAAVVTEMARLHMLRLEDAQRERLVQILIAQMRRMPMVQMT